MKTKKEKWLLKSNQTHNNYYDYSLVIYKNTKTKVNIICPVHGVFSQRADVHKNGQGCRKCSMDKVSKYRRLTYEEFIHKCKMVHGDLYRYFNYYGYKNKCKIECVKCNNIFEQLASNHLKGQGCPKCGIIISSDKRRKRLSQFIKDSNNKHFNKYNYSKSNYINCMTKLIISCPGHGDFEQTPNNHLQGKGCPSCKESYNVSIISNFLDNKNIKYIKEHKFQSCININPLPFDFYLPDYNMCIEYDGEHHYIPIENWGGINNLKKVQINDSIKDKWCSQNRIFLIRIPFWESPIDFLTSIENIN